MSAKVERDLTVKSRVEQLDALELDQEVRHVLKNQLMSALKFLPPSLQNRWEPEIDTMLQIVILHLSLRGMGATFGQQLLNIEFLKSQRKTVLFAVVTPVLFRYIQIRGIDIATITKSTRIVRIVESLTQWGEISIAVGSLINLLLFIHSGSYPNLLYRILHVEMAYKSPQNGQRQVGYSHMTRELIWHSFIELLMFVLPLINYHYIKRQVLRVLMLGSSVTTPNPAKDMKISYTVNTKCAVCTQRPVLPRHMDCDHVFCFYCLEANILANPQFPCPQCGHRATGPSSAKPLCLTIM